MAQLMPLPLTVSCFSKILIGFTFLVPARLGSPGQRAVKRVCVCVAKVSFLSPWLLRSRLSGPYVLFFDDPIPVRLIISKSTRPIFAKIFRVDGTMHVDDQSRNVAMTTNFCWFYPQN